MNVQFFLPLFMLAAITHTATAQCGGNLTADYTFQTLVYNTTGSKNKTEETCTWYISPSKAEPAKSYLSLAWNKFDVRGKLPACSDYVEVFITKSYKSIGRYCSDNMIASAPFSMYSYDGHAKIVFYSKARNRTSSFSLTYDTYNSANTIFGKTNSTFCLHSGYQKDVNIYATGGWPYGYAASLGMCQIRYGTGLKNTNGMIAVMDLDMEKLWDSTCSGDFLRVLQSESLIGGFEKDTGPLCGSQPYHFTATMKYVWIRYKRSQASSKRGGIIGYLSYIKDPSQITTTPSQMTTTPSQMTTTPSQITTTPSQITTTPSQKPTGRTWSGTTASKTASINVYLASFVIFASLIY